MSVGQSFIADAISDASQCDVFVECCRQFHQDMKKLTIKYREEARRHNYVTPTSYLELIGTFRPELYRP